MKIRTAFVSNSSSSSFFFFSGDEKTFEDKDKCVAFIKKIWGNGFDQSSVDEDDSAVSATPEQIAEQLLNYDSKENIATILQEMREEHLCDYDNPNDMTPEEFARQLRELTAQDIQRLKKLDKKYGNYYNERQIQYTQEHDELIIGAYTAIYKAKSAVKVEWGDHDSPLSAILDYEGYTSVKDTEGVIKKNNH